MKLLSIALSEPERILFNTMVEHINKSEKLKHLASVLHTVPSTIESEVRLVHDEEALEELVFFFKNTAYDHYTAQMRWAASRNIKLKYEDMRRCREMSTRIGNKILEAIFYA